MGMSRVGGLARVSGSRGETIDAIQGRPWIGTNLLFVHAFLKSV